MCLQQKVQEEVNCKKKLEEDNRDITWEHVLQEWHETCNFWKLFDESRYLIIRVKYIHLIDSYFPDDFFHLFKIYYVNKELALVTSQVPYEILSSLVP